MHVVLLQALREYIWCSYGPQMNVCSVVTEMIACGIARSSQCIFVEWSALDCYVGEVIFWMESNEHTENNSAS